MFTILFTYSSFFFFFNDTATTEIYTLSLHDALPIFTQWLVHVVVPGPSDTAAQRRRLGWVILAFGVGCAAGALGVDRKSTRLNSSHGYISYAVFCLKKKQRRKSNSPR